MKTLSAKEFLKITEENPEWAKTLTQNITVTGGITLPENHPLKALNPKLVFQNYADFRNSRITVAEGIFHQGVDFSYSQIQRIGELNVLGTDKEGNAANFYGCKQLTIARGTFSGFVNFYNSEIQQIAKDLQILAPNEKGYAASFYGCNHLIIATGTFPGWVNFELSGIQKIADDLHITAPDKEGYAASFWGCKRLTIARGTFPGFVDFSSSGIQKIAKNLNITAPNEEGNAAYFMDCQQLHIASGTFCGTVDFTSTPITHARNLKITAQEGKPKAIFTEPCLKELPFPIEEIEISKKLKKQLRLNTLHKNLKNHFPPLPRGI